MTHKSIISYASSSSSSSSSAAAAAQPPAPHPPHLLAFLSLLILPIFITAMAILFRPTSLTFRLSRIVIL